MTRRLSQRFAAALAVTVLAAGLGSAGAQASHDPMRLLALFAQTEAEQSNQQLVDLTNQQHERMNQKQKLARAQDAYEAMLREPDVYTDVVPAAEALRRPGVDTNVVPGAAPSHQLSDLTAGLALCEVVAC